MVKYSDLKGLSEPPSPLDADVHYPKWIHYSLSLMKGKEQNRTVSRTHTLCVCVCVCVCRLEDLDCNERRIRGKANTNWWSPVPWQNKPHTDTQEWTVLVNCSFLFSFAFFFSFSFFLFLSFSHGRDIRVTLRQSECKQLPFYSGKDHTLRPFFSPSPLAKADIVDKWVNGNGQSTLLCHV